MKAAKLYCPLRGQLEVPEKAKDQLTATEEKRRIDCIKFLLTKKYPKEHFRVETTLLRFGNKGRNSFRTDIVIFDCPAKDISTLPLEAMKEHILLIAEIKRDHKGAEEAKAMQVKPAMYFLHDSSALGVYWDDVEQRFFYFAIEAKKRKVYDLPINKLPKWGAALGSAFLTYGDLEPAKNLLSIFIQIEDELHSHTVDKSKRFNILLQLLLAKIYDEHTHETSKKELEFQDFSVISFADTAVIDRMNDLLGKAVKFYGKYLPEKVPDKFNVANASVLRKVTKLLAPLKILSSRRDVIQEFYMYFAKGLYKWDLAQYFTPNEVVDCVIKVINPMSGEHVKDPACGSGDFLISTLRWGRERGWDSSESVWGSDSSSQAVQVSILNMVLNGDGKSNIRLEDSLLHVLKDTSKYDALVCNPPFGIKIKESRPEVLKHFELGHEWTRSKGEWHRNKVLLKDQETGVLFAELCIRQAQPGGRVGIIVPNGYLGNRSPRYVVFRDWLLRQARVVSIISLPRFTFKKSGADVSASLLFLERRTKELKTIASMPSYQFHVGMVTSVGWSVGDKRASRLFARNSESGAILMDQNNDPIPDADFDDVLEDLFASPASKHFKWLMLGRKYKASKEGWSIPISHVLETEDLMLDPKRLNRKFVEVQATIQKKSSFRVGDVVEVIPEAKKKFDPSKLYRYVELGDIAEGGYSAVTLRGWELPSRARHEALPGEIFAGKIWGSVGKWFMAGGETQGLIVTNGCYRLRVIEGKEDLVPDLIIGMCSEAYRVQMRGYATGSDGLAEVSEKDICSVLLPRLQTDAVRAMAKEYLQLFLDGKGTLKNAVRQIEKSGSESFPKIPDRKTVFVQV